MTIETYISSNFKKKSGFYISLFWSSAGLGAILGSLIIAINGVNLLSYYIALILVTFQFIPVLIAKLNVMNVKIEIVKFSLSFEVIKNIRFILLCVFLLGISDAGWSSLFPAFLIEKGYGDKNIGQIMYSQKKATENITLKGKMKIKGKIENVMKYLSLKHISKPTRLG